jgi:large subunit ribosomal protein L21
VTGKILQQARARKVRIVKFKQKVHYRRTRGHRQHFTKVQITKVA